MLEDQARIDQAIHEAASYVERMAPSPGARELRARLETFRRVLASWGTVNRPTREQVDALIDRVNEIRRLARDTAPTRRLKAIPEDE